MVGVEQTMLYSERRENELIAFSHVQFSIDAN